VADYPSGYCSTAFDDSSTAFDDSPWAGTPVFGLLVGNSSLASTYWAHAAKSKHHTVYHLGD